MPAWFSDGFKGYLPAILGHFGIWVHPERRQDKGPWPKPRWMPLPGLLYAQVVKQYRRKRVVGVRHRVVFGTLERVQHVLAACGWKINTSFIERLNLDLRQRVAAIGRRVNTLCQGEDGLQHQLALFHVYHNFVLPHERVKLLGWTIAGLTALVMLGVERLNGTATHITLQRRLFLTS